MPRFQNDGDDDDDDDDDDDNHNYDGIALEINMNNYLKVAGRVERQFGDFRLFCPAEPEEYLDRTYGPSWPHTGIG